MIVAPGELPRMTRQVIDALVGAGIGRQVPGFYDRAWLADQIEQVVDFRKRGLESDSSRMSTEADQPRLCGLA